MTIHQSAWDAGAPKPSLEAMQGLQEDLTPDVIAATLRCCKVSITTGGDAGVEADIPVGAEIVYALVHCTRSNGSGSMTVKTNAESPASITDAIACVTLDAIDKSDTIDQTYKVVGADGVAVFANAAADAGDTYIFYLK